MGLNTLLHRLLLQRLSWPVHLAFIYAGVVLPILCHLMTLDGPPDGPSWQTGALDDKLAFTLSYHGGLPFYPLMLYSIVSLCLLLYHEQRFSQSFIARFGVFTGVPVAAWYSVMLGMISTDVPHMLSWGWLRILVLVFLAQIPPLLLWGLMRLGRWLWTRIRIPWTVLVAVILAAYFAISVISALVSREPTMALAWPAAVLGVFAFFSLLLAPYWCLNVYLAMSIRLVWLYPQPPRFGLARLLAVVSWAGAFLGSCRWAVVRSLEEYAKLPLENVGDCYIASAAAHGHPRVVKSTCGSADSTAVARCNQQLRVFKAGELALLSLTPRVHRALRKVYDALGPLIARRLTNPYLADAAYLTLKPAEWFVHAVLRWGLRIEPRYTDALLQRAKDPP